MPPSSAISASCSRASDGLDLLRRVADGARQWLAPGGAVLCEVSERQAGAAVAAVRGAGLEAHLAEDDERGATVVTGVRTP